MIKGMKEKAKITYIKKLHHTFKHLFNINVEKSHLGSGVVTQSCSRRNISEPWENGAVWRHCGPPHLSRSGSWYSHSQRRAQGLVSLNPKLLPEPVGEPLKLWVCDWGVESKENTDPDARKRESSQDCQSLLRRDRAILQILKSSPVDEGGRGGERVPWKDKRGRAGQG